MAFGSKKGTQIYFSFSLNSPAKRTPTTFPNRAPMERDTRLQGNLHISQRPHKNSSNKKAPRKKRPSKFLQSGARTEADAHFRSLLNISFVSPAKKSSLRVPFMESLAERYPFPRALLHPSFKVPCVRAFPPPHQHPPRYQVPSVIKGPLYREMAVSEDFFNVPSRVPSEGAAPQGPFPWPLQREKLRPQSPLHPSLKVSGRRALLQVPQTGPLWKEMPVSRTVLYILQGPRQGSPPSTFPSQSSQRERHSTSRAPFNHISKSPLDEPTPGCPTQPT